MTKPCGASVFNLSNYDCLTRGVMRTVLLVFTGHASDSTILMGGLELGLLFPDVIGLSRHPIMH